MSPRVHRSGHQEEEGMPLASHAAGDGEEGTPLTYVRVYNHPSQRARRRKVCFCVASVATIGVFVAAVGWRAKKRASDKTLQPAPMDIHHKCSAVTVSHVDGFVACEKICQVALCCSAHEWDPASCLDENEEVCKEYAPCYILDVIEDFEDDSEDDDDDVDDDEDLDDDDVDDDDVEDDGGDAEDKVWTDVPPVPSELASVCGADSLAAEGGYSKCEELCLRAECCWTSAEHNCYYEFSECYHYSPCLVLLEEENKKEEEIPPAPSELTNVCGADSLSAVGGYSKCKESCLRAECCWTSAEHNCYFEFSECYHYSPCLILLEEEDPKDDDIAAALAIIHEICDAEKVSSREGRQACEDACRPGQCCHAKGKDSCSESRDCADFEPCKILN